MKYGYIRVSTIEQNIDRQLAQLTGLDYIYVDKLSGKDTKRPQLEIMLSKLQVDDCVVICSIDRLARNVEDLHRLVRIITKDKNANIQFIKENMIFSCDETNPMNNAMLGLLAVFAAFERDMINARIKEGIAVKREKGGYKLTQEQLNEIKELAKHGMSKVKIAQKMNVSRNSIYYYLNKGN